MQDENYKRTAELKPQIKEIKKTFKGNEQFYVLNTFFRQNRYYPFYCLKNLAIFLLMIPFFISAYKLLSQQELANLIRWHYEYNPYVYNPFLNAFSFTKPDGILTLFGLKINCLPIIMTGINLLAGFKYTKSNSLSDRIQLIVTPLIFLVLLYNAPAGLVIYWIFNNIFSLFKNVIIEKPNFNNKINVLKYIVLFIVLSLVIINKDFDILVFIVLSGIIFHSLQYLFSKTKESFNEKFIDKIFILTCISYILIFGLLIPTNIISSDVFSFLNCNIKHYLFNIIVVSFGIFGVWATAIYFSVFSTNSKFVFTTIFSGVLFGSIYELFVSNGDFGTLNTDFQFESPSFLTYNFENTVKDLSLDLIIYFLIFIVIAILIKKQKAKILSTLLYTIILSSFLVSSINYYKIATDSMKMKNASFDNTLDFEINLTKNKNNVIIIMLDRAMSIYLPHIFKDRPDLEEAFDGFTYFPNTLSFGAQTITAYPSLIGGYDYEPREYFKSMKSKYNESLLVLPTLYKNNNYDVTLIDMPWAGFKDIYDENFYKNNEISNDYNIFNKFYIKQIRKNKISLKNSVYFSIVLISPKHLKKYFYKNFITDKIITEQSLISKPSIDEFSLITKKINSKSTKNCFVVINSLITHGEILNQDLEKYTDVKSLKENFYFGEEQKEYNANLVGLIKTAEFLLRLKQEGLYDNSRIIIVADHGSQFVPNRKEKMKNQFLNAYNPLLMVKDINNFGKMKINNEFMINADVPYLATNGLIKQAKNPFTQKKLKKGQVNETYYLRIIDNTRWSPSHFKKINHSLMNTNQFYIRIN